MSSPPSCYICSTGRRGRNQRGVSWPAGRHWRAGACPDQTSLTVASLRQPRLPARHSRCEAPSYPRQRWILRWRTRRRSALAAEQKFGLKGSVEPVLVTLGANIRHLRQRQGWTQTELARAINTTRISIGRLERGQQNATIVLLSLIAKALKVELAELVKHC
ncbi:MAG: XRE family transcriptional regulator [Alphaproteobacteria bacterium]|nr:MAG: XRE family transcriptional regulator [Alphaproteobacteria bacterium]